MHSYTTFTVLNNGKKYHYTTRTFGGVGYVQAAIFDRFGSARIIDSKDFKSEYCEIAGMNRFFKMGDI